MQNYCENYCGTCKVCRAGALERLRRLLPVGTTVFTMQTHRSDSGTSRDISVFIPTSDGDIRDISGLIIDAGLGRQAPQSSRGIRVGGRGFDAGFHVVHRVSQALHGDGFGNALTQRWL